MHAFCVCVGRLSLTCTVACVASVSVEQRAKNGAVSAFCPRAPFITLYKFFAPEPHRNACYVMFARGNFVSGTFICRSRKKGKKRTNLHQGCASSSLIFRFSKSPPTNSYKVISKTICLSAVSQRKMSKLHMVDEADEVSDEVGSVDRIFTPRIWGFFSCCTRISRWRNMFIKISRACCLNWRKWSEWECFQAKKLGEEFLQCMFI